MATLPVSLSVPFTSHELLLETTQLAYVPPYPEILGSPDIGEEYAHVASSYVTLAMELGALVGSIGGSQLVASLGFPLAMR